MVISAQHLILCIAELFFQNEGLRNSLRKTEDMLANAQRKVHSSLELALSVGFLLFFPRLSM